MKTLDIFSSVSQGDTTIDEPANITQLILAYQNGDYQSYDRAVELLYGELRGVAHRQLAKMHGNHTLQTTAVVNEAYLKLRSTSSGAIDRQHFLGIAAKAMRHVIIDYARKRRAAKRGGDVTHIDLDQSNASIAAQADQLLLIDGALNRLNEHNPQLAKVFECKFFAGLDDEETAGALGLSKRTAQRQWMKARAFLSEYLIDS